MTEGDRKEIKKLLKTTYNSGFDAGVNAALKAIETTPQGENILDYVKDFFTKNKDTIHEMIDFDIFEGKNGLEIEEKMVDIAKLKS